MMWGRNKLLCKICKVVASYGQQRDSFTVYKETHIYMYPHSASTPLSSGLLALSRVPELHGRYVGPVIWGPSIPTHTSVTRLRVLQRNSLYTLLHHHACGLESSAKWLGCHTWSAVQRGQCDITWWMISEGRLNLTLNMLCLWITGFRIILRACLECAILTFLPGDLNQCVRCGIEESAF